MLARLSIRAKVRVALGMLLLAFLLPAIAGTQGSYAYRQLAHSLADRADEQETLIEVTREVDALLASLQRMHLRDTPNSLFEDRPASVEKLLHTERGFFVDSLKKLEEAIDAHREEILSRALDDPLQSASDQELMLLQQMQENVSELAKAFGPERTAFDDYDEHWVSKQVGQLVERAAKLPEAVRQRMSSFRADVRSRYHTWIGMAWTGIGLTLVLFLILGTLFHRLVLQPFNELIAGCRQVAAGHYNTRIKLRTRDELEELARVLNSMTERFQQRTAELNGLVENLDRQVQQRTQEVVRSEQLASVGFLAAGVAHEINNPLGAIAWSAEALESRMHDVLHGDPQASAEARLEPDQIDALRTNLRRIQDEAFRCKGITERLLDFSRLGNAERQPTDLRELVEDVVAMVKTLGQYRRKEIHIVGDQAVTAVVNPQEIRQVVLNLLTNALESLGASGSVQIQLQQTPEEAHLTVSDDGCGMDEEVQKNLFEPFFTRRRDGRGTGLGLSITYRIVQEHGGQITAFSRGPGQGSQLEVRLPAQSLSSNDANHYAHQRAA